MMAENTELAEKATEKLKNLSGKRCVPTEFIKQTVKIRKVAEKWLKTTGIIEIIRKEANLIKIYDDMSEEEKKEAIAKNEESSKALVKEKALGLFDAAFEKDPDGTLELLALSCFTDPKDVDSHTMAEYFEALDEMANDKNVINFFISFIQLGHMSI